MFAKKPKITRNILLLVTGYPLHLQAKIKEIETNHQEALDKLNKSKEIVDKHKK